MVQPSWVVLGAALSPEKTELWKQLFSSPEEWEDLRAVKLQPGRSKLPDFRQPTSGQAIWMPIILAQLPACTEITTMLGHELCWFGPACSAACELIVGMNPGFKGVVEKLDSVSVPLASTKPKVAKQKEIVISEEARALWEQLFTDITQFDDFRALKMFKGGIGPDFSHKLTKKGLWLTGKSLPPSDILKRAESLPPAATFQPTMRAEKRALWELLLSDFSQFEDFRQFNSDRGGTAPDFKHTESGEGLWLTGKLPLPEDILTGIAALPPPPRFQPVMSNEIRAVWEQLFTDITQFDDFRQFKAERGGTGADFRHKVSDHGLWLTGKFDLPADIALRAADLPAPLDSQASPLSAEKRALWELLFTDIAQFEDFRELKATKGGTAPEFKHRASGEGLWVTGRFPLPADIARRLSGLPPPVCSEKMMRAETHALWELLFADMTQFTDFRQFKADRGGNGADFKHKQSGEGLWLTGTYRFPADIAAGIAALPPPKSFQGMPPERRALWELLFTNFDQFDDLRQRKADSGGGGNGPDFRHKQSDVGLWLTGIFPLPDDIAARAAALPPPVSR